MTTTVANVLQPLIDVAEAILKFWHDEAGFSWGASIIAMTVVVRIAILPLTYRGIKGIQNMQRLAPEIKKLQEKYKDDKQRQQQEMMRFYQEQKVNPLASCLPFILQIPFFISLFYLLRSDSFQRDIRGEESFLFIKDLAEPATGDPGVLITLIVLYVATQLAASLVTAISADRTQRMIALGLPFVFIAFIITFETGLLVYWITTNVWTIGQQLVVKRFMPPPAKAGAEGDGDDRTRSDGADEEPTRRSLFRPRGEGADNGGAQQPAAVGSRAAAPDRPARKKPPPRSPRKKRKRSGRRR